MLILSPNPSDVIVPAQLSVTVGTTTATSISLSWTSAGSEVDSYEVMWTSGECPDGVDEGSATITETSYIIEDLREGIVQTTSKCTADSIHSRSASILIPSM